MSTPVVFINGLWLHATSWTPWVELFTGHSFGGMIGQKLLGQDLAAGTVAVDAAQIKGVLPLPLSALRATLPHGNGF